jgi:hypothetical protein
LRFNIQPLDQGVYLLKIAAENGEIFTEKIVKN